MFLGELADLRNLGQPNTNYVESLTTTSRPASDGALRVTLYNWSSKKKVRPHCRTFGSPVFTFARISIIRKMVKRGKIAATKWR
jgi:hypothetical protein